MKLTSLLLTLALTGVLAGYAFAAGPGPGQGQDPTAPPAVAELSDAEIADILLMREEEKLARDVYQEFAELYDCPIFANIAVAEQRHMDAVALLISKYGLDDPAKDDTPGVFTTPQFAELFDAYVKVGQASLAAALNVGLEIEELDIEDLEKALDTEIQASDVQWVFENLLNASYRHLRAFSRAVATGAESCTLQGWYARLGRASSETAGFACPWCGGRGLGQGRRWANGSGYANGTCDGTGQADMQQTRDGSCQTPPEASANE